MDDDELRELAWRYGSAAAPPWTVAERADGRGYIVRSSGGNDIIAIKHYSPTLAAAIADVIAHCHEDVGELLAEVRQLRAELRWTEQRANIGYGFADVDSEERQRYLDAASWERES